MEEIIDKLKAKLKTEKSVRISVKVVAGAKKNSLEMFTDEIFKIKINKPAVDGKANKAIIEYLSGLLNLPKSNISILKGEKSSLKDLLILSKSPIIQT